MTLAIFDLDNTLLAGDSDHAWGEFLVEEGIVDAEEYRLPMESDMRITSNPFFKQSKTVC